MDHEVHAEKCNPCLRNVLLPMSRNGQRQIDSTDPGMRRIGHFVLIAALLAISHAAVAQSQHDTHLPEALETVHLWQVRTCRSRVKAGIGQLRGHPRSYGGGMAGFGKRLGAGFTTHAVKTTVEHIIAAPLHEDLHYHIVG